MKNRPLAEILKMMEAASQKLAIISTAVSAIPEFIDNGVHGILSDDAPKPLSAAILALANAPERRTEMAEAAYMRLQQDFTMMPGIKRLDSLLRQMCKMP